jgi:galactose oxidase
MNIRKNFDYLVSVANKMLFLGGLIAVTAALVVYYMPASASHDDHMMRMTATSSESFTANQALLPRTGWTATASDNYTYDTPAQVLDGNKSTIWHSKWDGTPVPLPHSITIDTKAVQNISGLSYLPRQDGLQNGNIGQYTITTSTDGTTWSSPVAQGTWADTNAEKQVTFNTVSTRYVRLTALTEAGNRGPWSSAAEINLAGDAPNTVTSAILPRSGWTAFASDNYVNNEPIDALDGDAASIWHSKWDGTPVPLPHSITIDMQTAKNISGMTYLPRQDDSNNGNIGQYTIAVSLDGSHFGAPIASGTWADTKLQKTVTFPTVNARYVQLTGLTEAGNRGPWSSAAEINVIGEIATVNSGLLPRGRWTVTASDNYTYDPPEKAIDGSTASIWHSKWDGTPVPLPHSITIDMKDSQMISGLNYLPRQDGTPNGNIGQYSISVSSDGTNWGDPVAQGTWSDSADEKKVSFLQTTARYIRLTALTEAGNRGPWSSAAEINVVGELPLQSADKIGKWGASIGFPLVPTSAVLLPNNKLLTFSAYSPRSFDYTNTVTQVSMMDLASGGIGQAQTVDTHHQMFCTGITLLADGKVLINGGSSDSATTIYDPFKNTWTQGPLMTIPRAYQGNTLLSTGQVFTIGGSWYDKAGNKNGEVWTPNATTGSWSKLTGVPATNILTNDPNGIYRADNHAWLFATANGGVFHAGPSKQMNWITTAGTGSITSAGNRADSPDDMNGNAVLYDVGKLLTVGGAPGYEDTPATARAYTVDFSGGPTVPVKTARLTDMAYQRAFNNSVVMPDGKVMVIGGQPYPKPFTDTGGVLSPELWDPATGKFTVMAPEASPRTYHSVAALLPDGRIFSGGGGLCGNCTTNHLDGQIMSPPYLLNPDGSEKPRPAIITAPAIAAPGTTITVKTSGGTPSFALIRTSGVTHSINNDQRRVPLSATTKDNLSYTMQVPSSRGVVLPGYYMLFALDGAGTPSVASFIQIN